MTDERKERERDRAEETERDERAEREERDDENYEITGTEDDDNGGFEIEWI